MDCPWTGLGGSCSLEELEASATSSRTSHSMSTCTDSWSATAAEAAVKQAATSARSLNSSMSISNEAQKHVNIMRQTQGHSMHTAIERIQHQEDLGSKLQSGMIPNSHGVSLLLLGGCKALLQVSQLPLHCCSTMCKWHRHILKACCGIWQMPRLQHCFSKHLQAKTW